MEKEQEASLIADAIEKTHIVLLENLATKDELKSGLKALELSMKQDLSILELSTKADIKSLEYRLTIRLTAIMAALLTFLPLATDFARGMFKLN